MNHHIWCSQVPQSPLPDGTCRECHDLYLRYPAIGNLDHEIMLEDCHEVSPETGTDALESTIVERSKGYYLSSFIGGH
jgi:hypothetical protein